MICQPCQRAADALTRLREAHPDFKSVPHLAEVCRDKAIQPHGCCCQHGQRNATDGNEAGQ